MQMSKFQCPQYLALSIFGDKWTLLIIRDMLIEGKRYFREFLQSEEKIASNILASRLKFLEKEGIIHKKKDPDHKQKIIYLLTPKGIDLLPILLENARWSLKYMPVAKEEAKKAKAFLSISSEKMKSVLRELSDIHH
ncbi:HxlR family transcriptional regulator [Aquimarina intermedia]|uniref:HxlR family transcriptional regulator n=2 Tax=Aquimarina intermedia TaxID=350814 RepID=A0A5S5CDR5_9FLAO|nr:HxlR family transcriptional regulator [Aquimarina intermedia]